MLPKSLAPLPETAVAVNRTVKMDDRLYGYLLNNSLREPELLQKLRRETAQYHMARMQISPEVGQFLGLLVKLQNPQKLLEIGVFTGYSCLSIGLAMGPEARLISLEKKQMWLDIACRYIAEAGLSEQISTVCGNALDSLVPLVASSAATFDFIFIDADKANLVEYYHLAKKLLKSGGCLAIDNTLWWGNVADEAFTDKDTCCVRQLNTLIHQDLEVDASLLPIGDGLTLVRKR